MFCVFELTSACSLVLTASFSALSSERYESTWVLPVVPISAIKVMILSTIKIAAFIFVLASISNEHSLPDSLLNLNLPAPAIDAMLPREGPRLFKKSKMLFRDVTASVLRDSVKELSVKRLFKADV